MTADRIIADGDHAVAEWTSYARARNGQPYRNDYAVVFRVADGLIDEVTEYFDTAYMKAVLFEQDCGPKNDQAPRRATTR